MIGQVADATGVTTKTLRFHERRGLLHQPDRTPGGYRGYPSSAPARVRFIKDAQAAGFTLAQITEILAIRDSGNPPCDHVATLVDQRLADVERRIGELLTVRDNLLTTAHTPMPWPSTTATGTATSSPHADEADDADPPATMSSLTWTIGRA